MATKVYFNGKLVHKTITSMQQPIPLKEESERYLSDKIKSFVQHTNSHIMQGECGNDQEEWLHSIHIGVKIASEPTEQQLKKFCDYLNKAADNGSIQLATLAPVSKFPLALVKPLVQNWALIFVSFTRLKVMQLL